MMLMLIIIIGPPRRRPAASPAFQVRDCRSEEAEEVFEYPEG
jgi:hypothetical protein